MPDCFEDLCPVRECSVCGGWVDEKDAGYCSICKSPFHWRGCGGWLNGEHVCENCRDNSE